MCISDIKIMSARKLRESQNSSGWLSTIVMNAFALPIIKDTPINDFI